MSKLSPCKSRELIEFLNSKGVFEIRQKGSHKFFCSTDGRTTVVPVHPSKDINPRLIRKILSDVRSNPEEFINFKK